MSEWFANGQRVSTIPIDDRSAQYGDGLFETIAIRDSTPRFWSLHMQRLSVGCERLGIKAPRSATLRSWLDAAIEASDIDTNFALAKIIVSAGAGPRGYRRDADMQPAVRIGVFDASGLPRDAYRDGVGIRVCRTRLAIQPQLAGIKSLARLEQVLARAEWDQSGIVEGLMLDTGDRLICGTMSNVFVASGNTVLTPAITRCGVSGVMRRHILTLLESTDIDVVVRDLNIAELNAATEVFLTNSQYGVLPVSRCGAERWAIGSQTRLIQSLAADNAVPECAP